ncbi:MAG: hypothetical protein NT003_02855 [Candidatus Magasanikbacteria bacterium]|nr:hypothetical protein [Candidatus Magasanikbacteria bacterium]
MENQEFEQPTTLDKGQRIGLGLLVLVTLLLIVVSGVQFRSNIFSYGVKAKLAADAALSPEQQAQNEMDALKKKDIDGDGLSDYDELYVYHSSPYMRDTDSDGIPDGEEVRRGTSPTCPEGKDCFFDTLTAQAASSSAPGGSKQGEQTITQVQGVQTLQNIANTTSTAPAAGVDANAQAVFNAANSITPQQIRDALIANGMSKEQVTAMTDDELIALLKQAQTDQAAAQPAQ